MSRQHPACFEVAASSPSEAGMNGCGGANLLMFTFVVIDQAKWTLPHNICKHSFMFLKLFPSISFTACLLISYISDHISP